MLNSYAIVMPSMKIGGGNRVLLQFMDEAIKNKKTCKLFFLDRKGAVFGSSYSNSISQRMLGDGVLSVVLFSIILSFRIRFDKSIDTAIVSDPILSIFSFIYANKKIIRFAQSNDFLLFESNSKGGRLFNSIYQYFFRVSQKYQYHSVLFNSTYSLNSYNETLTSAKHYSTKCIINPAVFTLKYEKNIEFYPSMESIRVCIVTSAHPRKGYQQFLEIAKHSKLKGVRYMVISQDDLDSKLKNVTHVKPSSDNEYVDTLKKCHFVLSTSTFEGFGLPLIEAMALGVVPIAFYNPGMDEYNTEKNITIIDNRIDFDKKIIKIVNDKDRYIKLFNSAIKSSSGFTAQNFYFSMMDKIQ
jgi:glycosyltransferase involved in cell wall biosynthesis